MSTVINESRFKDISIKPPCKVHSKSYQCRRCSGRGLCWWFIGRAYPDYGSGWSVCCECHGTGRNPDRSRSVNPRKECCV